MRSVILGGALVVLLAGASPRPAGAEAAPRPVFGAASADVDEPGALTPVGDGRFTLRGRQYVGRSLARSVEDDWATCFSGRLTAAEEWSLQAPKMTGTHESRLAITSERGVVTLRLRGRMEYPTASGKWELARATGRCAGLAGEGRYTARFSNGEPELELTFEGQIER